MRASMFKITRAWIVGTVLAGFVLSVGAGPAAAAGNGSTPPAQNWSFSRLFGTYDLAAAQRGLQVYTEVCATCHSLRLLSYRDLAGIGLSEAQIKAFAAGFTVPQGLNDQGERKEGPATPANRFKSPFPNEPAARAANNGALPPDLSLIANAYLDGPDYIYGLMTGYGEPPASMTMMDGMSYNKYFAGHQIAMPKPLNDGQVTYADGTSSSVEQMARDVVTFLSWAANPELTERKQMGVRVILFLLLMTCVTYAVKRKVWSSVH
jgi:ubiquinol-cytochrome c reductase cytochrome c1 subunit